MVSLKKNPYKSSKSVFLKKSVQKSVLVWTNPYEWEHSCREWRGTSFDWKLGEPF